MLPVLLIAMAAVQSPQSAHHQYNDWASVCDNGLRCEISSEVGVPENTDVRIHVRREAARKAAVRVEVESTASFGPGTPTLEIDGRRFTLVETASEHIVPPARAEAAVRALAAARRIAVVGGGKRFPIRTKGFAAALRDMDARQQRAGTVTALIATGSKPAESVPPPPPLPLRVEVKAPARGLVLHPSERRLAEWRRQGHCEQDAHWSDYPSVSWPLGGGKAVILVACYPGGHNSSWLVRVGSRRDGSDARPALFDFDLSLSENYGPSVPPDNPGRDEKTGRLVSGQSGGLVYPNTSETWVWDGSRFRLIERTGSYGSDFRARVVRR
jgi:hypothetical protein